MIHNLRINIDRLWDTLMASAAIGKTAKGGLRRLALSQEDGDMRRLFAQWCAEAGMAVKVDAMGNMFAIRPGKNPNAKAIMMASHLDTQIHGGRFDGILGVLGGLEVVRTLNERGIETEHPLMVVNWTNEEGARFEPPMIGSKVFIGAHETAEALNIRDRDGVVFGEALKSIGFAGKDRVSLDEIDSYFELHIEQGPELDAEGLQVGIVTGAYDVRWMVVEVSGENAHAGPTPMPQRRNAVVAAASVIQAVDAIGWAYHPTGGRTITARMSIEPNLLGIISHRAELLCDFRHPKKGVPQDMLESFIAQMPRLRAQTGCGIEIIKSWAYGGTSYDEGCASLCRDAAASLGYSHKDMKTVAGHDSMYLAEKVPSTMIFTPCENGISHNEAENVTPAMIEPGANVLLHAVLKRDAIRNNIQ